MSFIYLQTYNTNKTTKLDTEEKFPQKQKMP